MAAVFVGIDVSKDALDVHLRPTGDRLQVERTQEGLDALSERLQHEEVAIVAIEATGGYETVVAASLSTAGLPVIIINPAQVRSFARALGKQAKTDTIDAAVIAHFAEATNPELRPLADEATRFLADLMGRRRQIVRMIVAEEQRKALLAAPSLKKSVTRLLKALRRELAALDHEIDSSVRDTPLWREKEDLLRSVPGIGPTIARTLIAELPELGTLDRRQVASLAGLAPYTQQSGRWRGKSTIRGGRAPVRAMLFMGAMVAVQRSAPFRAFFQRLITNGKSKRAAYVAVARKLLTILNAIIRDRRPWQPA